MPNRIVFYPPTNSLGFLALLIPLTLGLSVVVLVIAVSVITVSVITVSVITVSVITVSVITVSVSVITVSVITVSVITGSVSVIVVSVSVIVVSVSVIVVAITIVIMVMTKQCARGRRHRFFGNVYRGVKCLASGFERVKWGPNGVTGHPKGILDHFICKALVIPVMTVMSAADSYQRGHHSE